MKRVVRILGFVIAIVLLGFVGLKLTLSYELKHYPESWSKVRLGDSLEDLKKKEPTVDTYLRSESGIATLYEPRLIGTWQTNYFFDESDRVDTKGLFFYLRFDDEQDAFPIASESLKK